mgnify:FL=1
MQRLTIKNFGPIKNCDIDVKDFLVLTGPQASGKSTVAKSVFFFNYLKDILFQYVIKTNQRKSLFESRSLKESFVFEVRNAFVQSFGENVGNTDTSIKYIYDNGRFVEVTFNESNAGELIVVPKLDNELLKAIEMLDNEIKENGIKNADDIRKIIYSDIFKNDMEILYIPAGRSLLTLLSAQIGYLYSVMDDRQKSTMDYCTQNYLERVLQIKSYFDRGPSQLLKKELNNNGNIDEAILKMAIVKMEEILKGEYKNSDGEELLKLSDNEFIKLNYASSGQQEAVWITNMLFYYMLGNMKTYFIIEEPESHLFPEAQKAITELISIAKNDKNKVLITTHSPYILGSINNLLYADKIGKSKNKEMVEELVSPHMWLSHSVMGAYYLANGVLENILDEEYQDINHDVIDGVSSVINETYEKLTDLNLDLED